MRVNRRLGVPCGTTRCKGFTLVEVLVALVIVGLALPALLLQISSISDQSGYLRNKTIAHWVADDQLRIQYLDKRLSGKNLRNRDSGEVEVLGQRWYWRMESIATDVPNMRRLEIEVGTSEDDVLISRSGFVYE